jgi:uncharacterized protein (TIGR03905 family)
MEERNNMTYKTQGTCSTSLTFTLTEGKVHGLSFVNGCEGNLGGLSKLVEGRDAHEVIRLLKGTPCGSRGTSCPDQLARALEAAVAQAHER